MITQEIQQLQEKKTGKDKKKGKATLISLLGHKNTIKYGQKLILKINSKLNKYGSNSKKFVKDIRLYSK